MQCDNRSSLRQFSVILAWAEDNDVLTKYSGHTAKRYIELFENYQTFPISLRQHEERSQKGLLYSKLGHNDDFQNSGGLPLVFNNKLQYIFPITPQFVLTRKIYCAG